MCNIESNIEELYMESIMSNSSTIIVEGHDDIPLYEKLSSDIGKNIQVIAVENIDGCNAGCDNVIRCIEEIQDLINEVDLGENYILGIIDRDARFYREEVPNLKCLFILEYYSFESHFTTEYGLKKILPIVCGISEKAIDEKLIQYLKKDLVNDFEQLFYISLEALKVACEQGYCGEYQYSQSAGYVFGKDNLSQHLPKINEKRKDLDSFAEQHDISKSDLPKIAKGKWYIHVYADSIFKNIKNLPQACKKEIINQCQYCKNGNYSNCMYKTGCNFQLGQIIRLLLGQYDANELLYIKQRISQLV